MSIRLILSAALLLVAIASPAASATVTSTTTGGLWSTPATWLGGSVPLATDEVIIQGPVLVQGATCARLVVQAEGRLRNASGGGAVTINGDLHNAGLITNQNYSFSIRLHGDVWNDGEISNPTLEFLGAGAVHHLSMGPDAVLDANVFLPEFQESTLIANTPVRFHDGLGLGLGTLILETGSSLSFLGHGGLGSGLVQANGNTVTGSQYAAMGGMTIDQAVLAGEVTLTSQCTFTGGLTNLGEVSSRSWYTAEVTVHGPFINKGSFEDGIFAMSVTALGDLSNEGSFLNSEVIMAGETDQAVGIGGVFSSDLILDSGLEYGPYQWYRDGEMLAGETGSTLTFSASGPRILVPTSAARASSRAAV